MIEFGGENKECGQNAPWLVECKELIKEYPENDLLIKVEVGGGIVYEIEISDYIMHLTRNELYTSWDDYEVRKGRYFVIFEKSRLIDFYDNVVMHTVDYDWPGKGVHYGIYTEMLLIDVITTVPPIIRRVSDNEAR